MLRCIRGSVAPASRRLLASSKNAALCTGKQDAGATGQLAAFGCATINTNEHSIHRIRSQTVPARILNGITIRDQIYAELKQEIAALSARGNSSRTCGCAGGREPRVADLCAQQDRGVRATGAWKLAAYAAGHGNDRRNARARCGVERARRCGRNSCAASSAAAGGHEACARSRGPGEGCGRVSSGESWTPGLGPRGARGVHARRVHGNSAAQRNSD